ncbi:uncharacterized protein CCOS01_09405 [Colletotrichum costaricense]|uniref:Uncharacterized protein n=1 Tax=Colletotrichum costaricense TaxID=1209916 RepID=A0AAI9YVH2_9PEZI|nr:uncharacterized protein CCOS01_09405 [Colletotrichum costaricense]KAK1524318.1 hypothetical protein CCOS01_09405 [Colletotrichum costaricense]
MVRSDIAQAGQGRYGAGLDDCRTVERGRGRNGQATLSAALDHGSRLRAVQSRKVETRSCGDRGEAFAKQGKRLPKQVLQQQRKRAAPKCAAGVVIRIPRRTEEFREEWTAMCGVAVPWWSSRRLSALVSSAQWLLSLVIVDKYPSVIESPGWANRMD